MSSRKALFFSLLLALVPSLVYWEVFRGDLLLPTDWVYQDMSPWSERDQPESVVNSRIKDAMLISHGLDAVSARAAARGDVLLWNRYAGGGMPHLATGFTRMLYPFFWIYAVLPSNVARNADVLLHLFLASLFAFAFLRRVHCNLEGSFLGGVIFGLTPSIVHRAEMSFQLPSLIWLPLLLYFIEAIATSGKLVYVAGLAVAVGFQINAGFLPDVLINCLGAGVYGVVRILTTSRAAPRAALFRLNLCVAGAALGVALAAPFLLTSLDLIGIANRPVTATTDLAETGLGWTALATMFTPWINRSTLFIGLVPLLFVPLAFRRGSRPVALALFAVFSTGLAIGAGTPILVVLEALVPPVRNLNYVHTLISLGAFGLALLAGLGLSQFFRESSRLVAYTAWMMLALAALARVFVWVGKFPEVLSQFQLPIALTSLGLLVATLEFRARRAPRSWVILVLLLAPISLELGTYARNVNPRIDAERFPPFPEFGSVEFLRKDPDLFRVGPFPKKQGPFWPNTLGAYGIEDVSAYQSLVPAGLGDYVNRVYRYAGGARRSEVLTEGDSAGNWMSLPEYRPSHLLRIWNLKYFIAPRGWDNPDPSTLELAYDDEVRVFRLKNWLPRAWLAEGAIVVRDKRGVYANLLEPSFNPERTVVFRDEPTCSFAPSGPSVHPGSESAVELTSYDAEELVLKTSSPRPGYLFLSQSYDPGWKARVDGESVPLLRANANFQAIALGAGSHEVTLRYLPDAYRWGWVAFWIGALVCLGFVLPIAPFGAWSSWLPIVFSVVPISVALAGWSGDRAKLERPTCGQLQVASRYDFPNGGESVELPNGTVVAHEIDAPGTWRWQVPPEVPSTLRFRLGRFDRARSEDVVWTLRSLGAEVPLIASGRLPASLKRWRRQEAPLPLGTTTVELETSSPSPALTSLGLGAPALLVPRPRIPSVVIFEIGAHGRQSDLASFGDERWRILLQLGDASAELTASFDESYSLTSDVDFSRRLLALAADLYRVASVLVVRVGPGADEGDFGRRQLELFRAELDRLGLTNEDVEIRVFDEN